MNKLILLRFFILFLGINFYTNSFTQVTIYTENFNNGCASGCLANGYASWTVQNNIGGVDGGDPNIWYVSCSEEGIVPPGCGSACIGDQSLHIGSGAGGGGDLGASFNETGAANATFRMAVSPVINTTTYSTITLSFDFIAFGSAACSDDRAQLRLSTDGGATWPIGFQYCLTSVCCGACNGYSQGQWTTYTLALPAAFNNNPNVRVGFHWRNNGNGSGTDPSIAVDDIRLTSPIPLSLDLLSFEAETKTAGTLISWKTQHETNFSNFELESSKDGVLFERIYNKVGNCSGSEACPYSYTDVLHNDLNFYRLKMVDKNGEFSYSKIISLDPTSANSSLYNLISSSVMSENLLVKINSKKKTTAKLVIYSISGSSLVTKNDVSIKEGTNQLNANIDDLAKGVYFFKVYFDDGKVLSGKVLK
jgi:hypothetical protein